MNNIINWLEGVSKKLPQLPASWKEVLVKIAPYLAIISIIIAVPAVLALLGFSAILVSSVPGVAVGSVSYGYSWMWIFIVAGIVLNILAVPGLFKRSITGWNFIFYSVILSAVQNVLASNIGGLIIGLAIGLYILFQIRPYYTGLATIPVTQNAINQ